MIDDYLNTLIKSKATPGIAYSLIYSNIIKNGAVGKLTFDDSSHDVSISTLYDLASLSKVIATNTIIARMLDLNLISLNDSVKKYFKEYNYDDISIFDLLTHTSGLPASLGYKDVVSKEKILNEVFNANKIYETGTDAVYSDLGFIILGEIIEKVFNKSLDLVANEEVFSPLGMTNTCYNPRSLIVAPTEYTKTRGLVNGTVHDEKAASMNGVAGSAGVFSNILDLEKFCLMVLNDGIVNNQEYLKKETIEMWFKPLFKGQSDARVRSIGWITGLNDKVILKEGKVISLSGFTGPSISIDKDLGVAIILLTNRVNPSRDNKEYPKIRCDISKFIYDNIFTSKINNLE